MMTGKGIDNGAKAGFNLMNTYNNAVAWLSGIERVVLSVIDVVHVRFKAVLIIGALVSAPSLSVFVGQSADAAFTSGVISTLPLAETSEDDIIYLPLVTKNFTFIPAAPVLFAINNPGGIGDYNISWSSVKGADTYILEEDDNGEFSSPAQLYRGSDLYWHVTGKLPGTYYYRVKASNAWNDSDWSNVQQVTVTPPAVDVYVENNTGGTLCYEVDDTGIGRKCFSSGTHFYGSFPSGTYTWHASAPCGSDSGTEYYGPGEYFHEFWCE
jgi:hypothetical protein